MSTEHYLSLLGVKLIVSTVLTCYLSEPGAETVKTAFVLLIKKQKFCHYKAVHSSCWYYLEYNAYTQVSTLQRNAFMLTLSRTKVQSIIGTV